MKQHSRTLILLLAVVALGASLISLYVHYRLLTDPTYTSFCDVSATVNCEAVYQSAYGSVWGVPVAAGGVRWGSVRRARPVVSWLRARGVVRGLLLVERCGDDGLRF